MTWEDGVTAILGWGWAWGCDRNFHFPCREAAWLTYWSFRRYYTTYSIRTVTVYKVFLSVRLALVSARVMTTMEGSRERSWTTSSRVLAKPTTWFSTGCRCFKSLWTPPHVLAGHRKSEVKTTREAEEWREEQSSDVRGEGESRRRQAGEEQEVEAEKGGSPSLIICLLLFFFQGAGRHPGGGEVVKEKRTFREATRREGSKEGEEQGMAQEEVTRRAGFWAEDARDQRSSAWGAFARSARLLM